MTCQRALDTMTMDLYGEASAPDARELALHLGSCRRCAKEMERLSDAAATIAQAEGYPARGTLHAPASALAPASAPARATAPEQRPAHPVHTAAPRSAWPARRLIYAAAAVTLFVVGTLAIRSRVTTNGAIPSEVGSATRASLPQRALPAVPPSSAPARSSRGSSLASVSERSSSSPYATDASVEAEISALDAALSKLESSSAEL